MRFEPVVKACGKDQFFFRPALSRKIIPLHRFHIAWDPQKRSFPNDISLKIYTMAILADFKGQVCHV